MFCTGMFCVTCSTRAQSAVGLTTASEQVCTLRQVPVVVPSI